MPEIAYLNGDFLPIEKAMVPVEDRGYQFGDAVYEVIASYNKRLFFLEEHLDRLERSMKELHFPAISKNRVRTAILNLFDMADLERAALYVQISRGVAIRNHAFSDTQDVQFVMTIRKVKEIPEKIKKDGASVITMKDFRWGRCDIKTVQLLPNVIAKQKAIDARAYDAIFVTEEGIVREATSSNVFIVVNKRLVTHPITSNILPGVTRIAIIGICKELNLPVEERFYNINDLYASNEVFLTGTITEVLPIVNIDGHSIGDGKAGPITKRLFEALQFMTNNIGLK